MPEMLAPASVADQDSQDRRNVSRSPYQATVDVFRTADHEDRDRLVRLRIGLRTAEEVSDEFPIVLPPVVIHSGMIPELGDKVLFIDVADRGYPVLRELPAGR